MLRRAQTLSGGPVARFRHPPLPEAALPANPARPAGARLAHPPRRPARFPARASLARRRRPRAPSPGRTGRAWAAIPASSDRQSRQARAATGPPCYVYPCRRGLARRRIPQGSWVIFAFVTFRANVYIGPELLGAQAWRDPAAAPASRARQVRAGRAGSSPLDRARGARATGQDQQAKTGPGNRTLKPRPKRGSENGPGQRTPAGMVGRSGPVLLVLLGWSAVYSLLFSAMEGTSGRTT